MPDKFEVAKILREISSLLELQKAGYYRIRAYQQGANAIEMLEDDLAQLCCEKRLSEISGIGPALASIIYETL